VPNGVDVGHLMFKFHITLEIVLGSTKHAKSKGIFNNTETCLSNAAVTDLFD